MKNFGQKTNKYDYVYLTINNRHWILFELYKNYYCKELYIQCIGIFRKELTNPF